MKFFTLFYLLVIFVEFGEFFFLFHEKNAIILCLKVCPLYCWNRHKRSTRYDLWDDDIYDWQHWPAYYQVDHYPSPSAGHWVYCKHTTTTPKPTTTTMATTTEEPTFICELCLKKCGTPKTSKT